MPPPPPSPTTRYTCDIAERKCAESPDGNFSHLAACQSACVPPSPPLPPPPPPVPSSLQLSGVGSQADGIYELQSSKCNGKPWWGKRGNPNVTCPLGECGLQCCEPPRARPLCNCGSSKEGNVSFCNSCGCFACGPIGQCGTDKQRSMGSCSCDPSPFCKNVYPGSSCQSGQDAIAFQPNVAVLHPNVNAWVVWSADGCGRGCLWGDQTIESTNVPAKIGWTTAGKSATISWTK